MHACGKHKSGMGTIVIITILRVHIYFIIHLLLILFINWESREKQQDEKTHENTLLSRVNRVVKISFSLGNDGMQYQLPTVYRGAYF